ncbi:DnaJ-like protein subfamily C member 22 [Trichoplax sp. H2]|uniref:DnaJ homolog subfamily C member 22 n=1 Tax=Trichoplax adhaerens TaxID=10228 RepID=B3RRF4_TRIAD|nr:hypothetical protein TRIADDRAFT_23261 [Trichoplax adhaerens]EDV26866.1 hypothetical protein TRIADDRAFT_23261 [Trichoplax adhaerens]RDD37639.1 DnaJ-like protein subfamily C member 22 [Trichoplax sp. H2]|eukprot:XP_002110862.1 hypothetical protein TRIADDRAFT_23261 [Trichoplax adhaerens]
MAVKKQKSLLIAYILLIFGGIIGLHHFYLGRDRHAFLYWSTLGGLFGLGCLRDLWRLPTYVRDANEDDFDKPSKPSNRKKKEVKGSASNRKQNEVKGPPFVFVRLVAQVSVAYVYGLITSMIVPLDNQFHYYVSFLFLAIGEAIAIFTVANVGRHKLAIKPALYISILAVFFNVICFGHENHSQIIFLTALIASPAASMCTTYKTPNEFKCHRGVFRRWLILALAGTLYITAISISIYHHGEVTSEDGERIKVKDAVDHFFSSPLWLEFKEVLYAIYQEGKQNGWWHVWIELNKALDPEGESNALKVLGLSMQATDAEIRRQYKKLILKWHPDKNPNNLRESEQKSIEINKAYEILSKVRNRRKLKANSSAS